MLPVISIVVSVEQKPVPIPRAWRTLAGGARPRRLAIQTKHMMAVLSLGGSQRWLHLHIILLRAGRMLTERSPGQRASESGRPCWVGRLYRLPRKHQPEAPDSYRELHYLFRKISLSERKTGNRERARFTSRRRQASVLCVFSNQGLDFSKCNPFFRFLGRACFAYPHARKTHHHQHMVELTVVGKSHDIPSPENAENCARIVVVPRYM